MLIERLIFFTQSFARFLVIESQPMAESASSLVDQNQPLDFTWLFLKTVFAMIAVIGLAVFILRFLLPKLAFRRVQLGKQSIRVVERIALDAKTRLYVLQVEERRLLLSATDHSVHLITELGPDDASKMDTAI